MYQVWIDVRLPATGKQHAAKVGAPLATRTMAEAVARAMRLHGASPRIEEVSK